MERLAKQQLKSNQGNTMIFLVIVCVSFISLNCLKCKQNNKDTIELINMISQI